MSASPHKGIKIRASRTLLSSRQPSRAAVWPPAFRFPACRRPPGIKSPLCRTALSRMPKARILFFGCEKKRARGRLQRRSFSPFSQMEISLPFSFPTRRLIDSPCLLRFSDAKSLRNPYQRGPILLFAGFPVSFPAHCLLHGFSGWRRPQYRLAGKQPAVSLTVLSVGNFSWERTPIRKPSEVMPILFFFLECHVFTAPTFSFTPRSAPLHRICRPG